MTVAEMLNELGEDARTTLERFMDNAALITKFEKSFLKDDSFALLEKSVKEKDYDSVLLHSHTLKGVSANLGFSVLSKKNALMVEAVRGGQCQNIEELFEDAKAEYERIIEAIKKLD